MDRSVIVVVLLSLLSQGSLVHSKSYSRFIVDGSDARVGAWPWMASIRGSAGVHLCGGTLLTPTAVLTSAFCVNVLASLDEVTVALGVFDQNRGDLGRPEVIRPESIEVHEDWDRQTFNADLAVIRLKRAASNNSFVRPIEMAPKDFSFAKQECTFTGWGTLDGNDVDALNPVLQQKQLVGWTNENCRKWWEDPKEKIRCASEPRGRFAGTCTRDAGGPLVCPKDDGYILAGVSIFWARSCVNLEWPGIFTNIPTYRAWIDQRIN